jgi:hypothetical protein
VDSANAGPVVDPRFATVYSIAVPRIYRQRGQEFLDEVKTRPPTDECILWPFGNFNRGYAQMTHGAESKQAHRAMCLQVHGNPPTPQHQAAHSCRNRSCVNPAHLSWKTPKENQADRIRDGTSTIGAQNGAAVLSENEVLAIRREIRTLGTRTKELAARFGVSYDAIQLAANGSTWSHLDAIEPPVICSNTGERVWNSKLTQSQVLEIRQRYAAGETQADLMRAFNIGRSHVFMLITNRIWKG